MKKNISFIIICILNLTGINSLYSQSIGNLSGDLSVNDNGAAIYSLDIPCPSGINGMQPKISLNYNSQSGQGIAGWGWNIGGLSMITRSSENYYFDNNKSSLDLSRVSNTDSYIACPLTLDGQRLIRYKFVPGMKAFPDKTWYYVENDKTTSVLFAESSARTPEITVTVKQKNGITMLYGPLDDTLDAEYHVGTGKKYNLGWALTCVYDSYGNYIEYSYNTDNSPSNSGNTRLSKITYGNFNDSPLRIVGQIEFIYKTSSQTNVLKYINGIQITNNNLLSKINVKSGNGSLIESYELTHSTVESNDYLTSIKKKNAANEYFNPLTFTYNTPSYNYEDAKSSIFANKPANYNNFIANSYGDIDGDGYTDILVRCNNYSNDDEYGVWALYRNKGGNNYEILEQGKWECQTETNFLLIDLDNDGKDELYIGRRKIYNNAYYYYLDCYIYENKKLVEKASSSIKFSISKAVYDDIGNKKNRQFLKVLPADFLGNGNTQFLLFDKDNKIIAQHGLPAFNLSFVGGSKDAQILLTDFNGNGKTELVYIGNFGMTAYEFSKQSDTSGSFNSILVSSQFNQKDEIKTGDFNGDGNTDLLVKQYNNNSSTKPWKIFISNGKDGLTQKDMSSYLSGENVTGVDFRRVYVVDANNDGKSDIFYSQTNFVNGVSNRSKIGLLISDGKIFENKILNNTGYSYIGFHTSGTFRDHLGKDIFINTNHSQQVLSLNRNVTHNKLIKITDSFGQSQNITYQNYNNPIAVGNQLKSDYDNDGKNQVVKSTSAKIEVVNTITGPTVNLSYQFEDPYFHKQGRGFLGFMKIKKVDYINKIAINSEKKLNTTFYILHPYKSTYLNTSTSQVILESTQNYTIVNEGNKVYFPRLDSEIVKDNLNGTSSTTTYSNYDVSRNAKTIKIDYGNNIKEEKNYVWEQVDSDHFNRVKSSVIMYNIIEK